jgi:hypothetical protein
MNPCDACKRPFAVGRAEIGECPGTHTDDCNRAAYYREREARAAAEATLATESAERVRCRDGWAAAEARATRWHEASQALMIEAKALRAALERLTALVQGECPSLLNEDSGGDARLDAEIDAILAAGPQPALALEEVRAEAKALRAALRIASVALGAARWALHGEDADPHAEDDCPGCVAEAAEAQVDAALAAGPQPAAAAPALEWQCDVDGGIAHPHGAEIGVQVGDDYVWLHVDRPTLDEAKAEAERIARAAGLLGGGR